MIEFIVAVSLHVGLGSDYNYVHPQLKYTHDEKYIVGTYLNSVDNVSVYAGMQWKFKNNIGIEAGIVTGYNQAAVLPFVRATWNNFFVMPAIDHGDVGAVFGYEWKF
jgi:hypothetical protein